MSKYCIECGTELPDNAKFCFSCGTKCLDMQAVKRDNPKGVAGKRAPDNATPPKQSARRLAKVDIPPVKAFSIAGNKIVFSQDFLDFNRAYSVIVQYSYEERTKFRKYAEDNIATYSQLTDMVIPYMEDVVSRGLDVALKACKPFGPIPMSEKEMQQITSQYVAMIDPNTYLSYFNKIRETHDMLLDGVVDPKDCERVFKGRWIGGGSGFHGAITGMLQASLMNMGIDLINGAFATAGMISQIKSISDYEKAVVCDPELMEELESCAERCLQAWPLIILEVYREGGKIAELEIDSDDDMTDTRIDSICKMNDDGVIDDKEAVRQLCECIQENPYNAYIYFSIRNMLYNKKTISDIKELTSFLGIDTHYNDIVMEDAKSYIEEICDKPPANSDAIARIIQLLREEYQYDELVGFVELVEDLQKQEVKMRQEEEERRQAEEELRKKEEAARQKEESEKAASAERVRQMHEVKLIMRRLKQVFVIMQKLPVTDNRIVRLWNDVTVPNQNMITEGLLCGFYYNKYYYNNANTEIKQTVIQVLTNMSNRGYPLAQYILLYIKHNEILERHWKKLRPSAIGFGVKRILEDQKQVTAALIPEFKKIWDKTSLIQAGLYYYSIVKAESLEELRDDYYALLKIATNQFFPPAMATFAMYSRPEPMDMEKYRKYSFETYADSTDAPRKYHAFAISAGANPPPGYVRAGEVIRYYHIYGPEAY